MTPRIVFNFLNCPTCKQRIVCYHRDLVKIIENSLKIENIVAEKAMQRAKHEGFEKEPRLKDANDIFFNKLKEFALYKCAYYMCYKCKEPYFGGMKDCE